MSTVFRTGIKKQLAFLLVAGWLFLPIFNMSASAQVIPQISATPEGGKIDTNPALEQTETKDFGTGSEGSWTEELDGDIYTGSGNVIELDSGEEEEEEPGIVESLLMSLFIGIADWANKFFESVGMSLDAIIMGRVGGHGVKLNGYTVSLFTFELKPGNPYGIVAAAAYSAMRGIIYIVVAVIVFGKLCMAAYAGGKDKAMMSLKDSASSLVVSLVALSVMPYLVDIAMYIRDVMIYAIGVKLGQDVMGLNLSELSIISMFRDIAENSFMNALMYFGTILLTLWFSLQYVGVAITVVVYFFAFPFVCVNLLFDRNALSEWCKNMLHCMLIPVTDLMLMFIPLSFSLLGDTTVVNILQFMVCSMVIPARTALRVAMGIGANPGMELAGLATMMGAMHLAGGAVRGTVGMLSRFGQTIGNAKRDAQMGKMYSEMDSADQAKMNDYVDMYNQTNGYGFDRVNGEKVARENEVPGIDSLSTGIAGMSKMTGIPIGSLDKEGAFSDDPAHLQPEVAGPGGIGGGRLGGAGTGGQYADILDKYANVNNFENPEFANISNSRRAELYRQRAKQQFVKGAGALVGGFAGMAGGAVAGAGAATFFSPAAKMYGASMGIQAGGALGEGIGSVTAGTALNAGGAFAGAVSGSLYNMQMPEVQAAAAGYVMEQMGAQALGLKEYIGTVTDPGNVDMRAFMDHTYESIQSDTRTYKTAEQRQEAWRDACVRHAMSRTEPYIKSNIHVSNPDMDPDIVKKLEENSRGIVQRRYEHHFSAKNMENFADGKYVFRD